MNSNNKNAWLRENRYRWRKNASPKWILIGPDGYPTTKEKVVRAIEAQRANMQTPQQWVRSMGEKRPLP